MNHLKTEQLVMSRKEASLAVALLLLLGLASFMTGYFWGYRQATTSLQVSIEAQAFADQVDYAMQKIVADDANVENSEQASNNEFNGGSESSESLATLREQVEEANQIETPRVVLSSDSAELAADSTKYYAELVGFGYQKSAQKFLDQALKKGYPVKLRKKIGRSGNKKVNWYQIVTEEFANQEDLAQIVKAIERTEKLQNIKIKAI